MITLCRIIPIFALSAVAAAAELPVIDRAVIVGLDGVSATGIVAADTPHMDRLIREGAATHSMRAVLPTASFPNWASFLMGAGPKQHGVTSNAWQQGKEALTPAVVGPGGSLPTIFTVAAGADLKTGAYLDWEPIARFLEPCCLDVLFFPKTGKDTTENRTLRTDEAMDGMIDGLVDQQVRVAFAQLDLPDHLGHKHGWESGEYLESITHVDGLLGKLIDALEAAGMFEKTLLIVVSDHGGVGTSHGGATNAEVLVPWIMRGPGVRAGHHLGPFANVEDTAPTVVAALGLRQPAAWSGRPLLNAFAWHPVPEITAAKIPPTTEVMVGERVEVQAAAMAPDDGTVEMWMDWGDGSPPGWRASAQSGAFSGFGHRFLAPGSYIVRAQAAAGASSISDAVPVAVFEVMANPAIPEGLVGLWEFSDPENPFRATFGDDLIAVGRAPSHHARLADEGDDPTTASGVIVTSGGPPNHLVANHRIGGNGGGAKTNVYSLVFDVMPPVDGGWHTFYQADLANRADAAFFMRPNPGGGSPADSIGRGGIGYSLKPLERGRWQRVAISADLTNGGAIRTFVDGSLFHEHSSQPPDGHWALDPRAVLLFADQDSENTPWAVAMAAIFDHALDADAVQALGGAGVPIIKHNPTNQ